MKTESKRIRVCAVRTGVHHTSEDVVLRACRKLKIRPEEICGFEIVKKSLDARKKEDIHYTYTVDLLVPAGAKISLRDKSCTPVIKKIYQAPPHGARQMRYRPVVIGAGPAGLFCTWLLAREGYRPVLFERGRAVEERKPDVENFWECGILDPESNVQFGEGGAGTFSDGKLNTGVNDRAGRNRLVLETFVRCGAPEEILYANKPHIGTDILAEVVKNVRREIIAYGGEVHFSSCVTDIGIAEGAVKEITVGGGVKVPCEILVLACGHSARDTFSLLHEKNIPMEAKPFAVGFRAEHPQEMIDRCQYGAAQGLPAADYKLTYHAACGRSVYSFCMCPGGYVVNASSEEGMLAVNGMSDRARDGANANSAVIVTITPEDFGSDSVLAGVEFQRSLERAAYARGGGKIPQQLLSDFEKDTASTGYGAYESSCRGAAVLSNLRGILPAEAEAAFLEGMHSFSKKIRQFDRPDVILSGVESRTSSPVRILRDETMQSAVRGLYPCGEGAGYAGGIMSAAMDGIKTAEKIIEEYAI